MVDKLVAREPASDEELIAQPFSHQPDVGPPFGLWRFLRQRSLGIAAVVLLVALETVLQQIGPRLTQEGIDHGITPRHVSVVVDLALVYVGALILGTVVSAARTWWSGRIGADLLCELRVRIFTHIQRLSVDYFTNERAGRIMTRVTSDVDNLQNLFQQGLINMVLQLCTLAFVLIQLFSMDTRLALYVVLGVLPVFTALTLWFRARSDYGWLAVRDYNAAVIADLAENLSGTRVVTANNRQRFNTTSHLNLLGRYRAANLYTAHIGALYGPSAQLIGVLATGVVLLLGGQMVLRGQLTIGALTAFVLYLSAFFAPIQQLVQLYNTYQQGRASVVRLRELFATAPTVLEAPDAVPLPPIEGELRLDGVSFGYDPADLVLEHVDLTIHPGETFALVGPTGAGKSTIAKLLARFYDPTAGRVLIDGHDLKTVTFDSLRSQLGTVPQEAFLFAGTIGDNVKFARPDASREEVIAACRAVGILELIEALPGGLDTPTHERGVTLSSGERQLIALARAFLASPRVLVLDEATSSLDLQTEGLVERALDVLLEGRTAVLIAHRLNTAMRADRIAVVDDGRLVEIGSHAELVARNGRYAEMFAAWRDQQDPARVGDEI
jgi:ATP-binding cassette subfamily B protein